VCGTEEQRTWAGRSATQYGDAYSTEAEATAALEMFSPGANVTCWYNPADPGHVKLDNDTTYSAHWLLMSVMVSVMIIVCIMLVCVLWSRSRSESRRCCCPKRTALVAPADAGIGQAGDAAGAGDGTDAPVSASVSGVALLFQDKVIR